ncbi:MAG: alpha/beta hydrolase family protein [Verrucomicrobiales bacterium]
MIDLRASFALYLVLPAALLAQPLAGTRELTWDGDIASRMIDAADTFLLKKIDETVAARRTPPPGRDELARIVGLVDARVPFDEPEVLGLVAEGEHLVVRAIRWSAFGDVHGEGLLVEPRAGVTGGGAIVIPDADVAPESLLGLVGSPSAGGLAALGLAEQGRRVVIPTLINRSVEHHTLTNREFIYRPAFVLGRHVIGYELQKVLALVDWMGRGEETGAEVLVRGHGEGGLLALLAGALDERIAETVVSGYSGPAADLWQELAYRNVFGILRGYDRRRLLEMIEPREVAVLPIPGPAVVIGAGESRGKPGRLLPLPSATDGSPPADGEVKPAALLTVRGLPDAAARHARQLHELDRHSQQLLVESPYLRAKFMAGLKTDSPESFAASQVAYREYFAEKVIGRFDDAIVQPDARTRELEIDSERVRAYEVVLDVFEDGGVFAYGILVVPNDIPEGESRPCVVCQHGLEGRPQSTVGEVDFNYYKAFATSLAERGYVTFAPQNLYIFGDRFRSLQFKANSIGRTLFSLMVPQHQQITDWLGQLDFVDARRIGFYGLSYGGKSAMRIPALVDNYCLSICSADFNDWVWKNASTRSPYSYVRTGEYEIFEFDLGSTFNYSEMAALIAPRPFMVERGHFDGVAPDERVALEFAKVRHLYSARLGLGSRAEIEWFVGPHTIHAEGTFEFLDRHLGWEPEVP